MRGVTARNQCSLSGAHKSLDEKTRTDGPSNAGGPEAASWPYRSRCPARPGWSNGAGGTSRPYEARDTRSASGASGALRPGRAK